MKIDTRKIQEVGTGSFVISLPKNWIQSHGLGKGDRVFVDTADDGSLSIKAAPFEEKSIKYTVSVSEVDGDSLNRLIISSYISGYDEILLTSNTDIPLKKRKQISETVTSLTGVEIVSDEENQILLKILDLSRFPILKIMKRMNSVTLLMFSELLEAVANVGDPDDDRRDDMRMLEWEVNRYYYMVLRQMNRFTLNLAEAEAEGIRSIEFYDYRNVASRLEAVSDSLKKINRYFYDIKEVAKDNPHLQEDVRQLLTSLLENTQKVYKNAYLSYEKNDKSKANHILDETIIWDQKARDLKDHVRGLLGEKVLALEHINEVIYSISVSLQEIAETVIDRTR